MRAPYVCVCVNTHTVVRKCCTSLLHYLDNRSAVGVMANNTLRLHHNARKLVFGEKTNASGSLTSLIFPRDL